MKWTCHVRFGSKADIPRCPANVCFTPESRHSSSPATQPSHGSIIAFTCRRSAGLTASQYPSTHAPADDRRFDWAAGIHTVPSTATPSAQKWNDIGADVIFAKKFMWLVRRRNTLVSEGGDSLLPCRHAVSIIPIVIIRCMAMRWHRDVLI